MASIYRWTRYHALIVFAFFIIAIIQQSAGLVSGVAFISFAYYIATHLTIETEKGKLPFWRSPANLITCVRVIILAAVGLAHPILPPITVGLIGVIILITDYFDGYMARKHRVSSLFGAQFDQESDAFFVGLYSLFLFLGGYVGAWVTVLGLLRYAYVIALFLLNQQHKKELRIRGAQVVAVMVMIALLVPYVTPPFLYLPYLILCTCALVYSFAYAFVAQLRLPDGE